jgi:hypothetical protein
MPKPFKDPLEVRSKVNGKTPWTYDAPSYDNRSSESISAGNDYGLGRRTPTGKFQAAPMSEGPIPQSNKCFRAREYIANEDQKG